MSEAIAAAGRVARKEFRGFFTSPAAWLFLGAFLLVSLFVVFWVERFFARNLADLRPLFEWMPLLLIFLVAALTMRSWAEERRAGTLESLLTAPLAPLALVMGKFLAALGLVALALLLTLPLAVSVSLLGLGAGDRRLPGQPVPRRRLCGHRPGHERSNRQPGGGADSHRAGLRSLLPDRFPRRDCTLRTRDWQSAGGPGQRQPL